MIGTFFNEPLTNDILTHAGVVLSIKIFLKLELYKGSNRVREYEYSFYHNDPSITSSNSHIASGEEYEGRILVKTNKHIMGRAVELRFLCI